MSCWCKWYDTELRIDDFAQLFSDIPGTSSIDGRSTSKEMVIQIIGYDKDNRHADHMDSCEWENSDVENVGY